MNPDALFPLINLLPLPIWLIWIGAPASRASRYLAQALWPWGILATLYGFFVLAALVSDAPGPGSFFTLAGVMSIFDQPWATMAGWMHFICFDLFCARWMVNDAPQAGYRLAPVLALTLFYGPLGLLTYLALRTRLASAAA